MSRVEVRPWEGEARLAGQRVEVTAEGRGLRFPGTANVWLRPLTFGERARVARLVADGENSVEALAAAVVRISAGEATVPEDARLVAEILSLHLAGAGSGAPGFAEEVGLLGRWMGWSPSQIHSADAADIDDIARSYGLAQKAQEAPGVTDDGWVSLQLDGPTSENRASPSSDLHSLRADLAADLLRRSRALPDLGVLRGAPNRSEAMQESILSRPSAIDVGAEAAAFAQGEEAAEDYARWSRMQRESRTPFESTVARSPSSASAFQAPVDSDMASRSLTQPAAAQRTALEAGSTPQSGSGPPEYTILNRALAPVGSPSSQRGSASASWTPSAEWIGPRDSLSAERLAAIYPVIFGGGSPPSQAQATPRAPASIDKPRASNGELGGAGGLFPLAMAQVGRELARAPVAAAASIAQGGIAAAGALGFDVDAVAKALHRAADLRGVSP